MARGTIERVDLELRGALAAFTPLQRRYLGLLSHLEEMRRDLAGSPIDDPLARRLIGQGIYSAFRACQELGIGGLARTALEVPTPSVRRDAI